MTQTQDKTASNRDYAIGIARALGGALLFSLPILMTMETWQLGFAMDRVRLALLLLALFPLLIALAYYLGFQDSTSWRDAMLDACAAIAVAVMLAALVLTAFGVLDSQLGLRDVTGKLALQSVTGSIGALLAQAQFGYDEDVERKRRESGTLGEYFFMAAGALFLCASVAPTEEVVLIAHLMTTWHTLALLLLSLAVMHAFVYAVQFRGQHQRVSESIGGEFVRFTAVGYLIALSISLFICWAFGRLDGVGAAEALQIGIVLAFPAAVGAAAARLVL